MRDFKAATYSRLSKRSGGGGGRADCKSREQERKNCGNKGTRAIFGREQGKKDPPPPPGRPSIKDIVWYGMVWYGMVWYGMVW